MVEALDQREAAHVFGLFAQPANASAGAYVTSVLDALRTQLDAIDQLRVAEGNPRWAPFPSQCANVAAAAAARLRAGVAHAASLVPGGHEHRLVFCLLPQAIERLPCVRRGDRGAAACTEDCARAGLAAGPADPARTTATARRYRCASARQASDVLVYEPDLSPPALMDAMAHDVAQPGLPEAQRMQMLTELASLDYAYGRLEQASAKYEILYAYYRRHQVQAMQAFVLQGIGMSCADWIALRRPRSATRRG